MIGALPNFCDSPYFESEPTWRLKKGADKKTIAEFEKFMNTKSALMDLKTDYPNMKSPYYSWTGEIVDKG